MTVTLLPETEEQIRHLLESGQYADANAVVAEGLDLLIQREQFLALKAAVDIGYQQYLRGEVVDMDDDFLERAMARAREDSRLGLPIPDEVKP